ncbi:MAG TPA: hypothetical protein VHW94_02690, partial [Candidatus Dormibacteraeota bacterium]|nr:hypothetical protein [Candidatus Dormibacteraeota bacterium]
DTLDGRLTQAVGDPATGIYTQHTVNGTGGHSKVTWYEIRIAAGVATKVQEGDITSSTEWVYNAAISPRGDGQGAVIFYNRSGLLTDPVIASQGRMVWTPTGQMDSGELVLATSAAGDNDFTCGYPNNTTTAACRWGDYSGASPDPSNPNVVWGSNQALTTPPGFPNQADPAWVTWNFAIAGPIVTRTAPIPSSPVPTPTRDPALVAPPGSSGTR